MEWQPILVCQTKDRQWLPRFVGGMQRGNYSLEDRRQGEMTEGMQWPSDGEAPVPYWLKQPVHLLMVSRFWALLEGQTKASHSTTTVKTRAYSRPHSSAEHRPRTHSQENRTSGNAFVNMFPFSNPTPGGVIMKRTNKIQHGGEEETLLAHPRMLQNMVSNTLMWPCFQGYHSHPFETTERVRVFLARSGKLKNRVSNTPKASVGVATGHTAPVMTIWFRCSYTILEGLLHHDAEKYIQQRWLITKLKITLDQK
jgi:hypothetical protein